MPNLTDKQEMFCREYLIDFNATQAAIRAGYSKKTARIIAAENLTKPNILERLNQLKGEVLDRNDVTIDELIGDLKRMKDLDPIEYLDEDGNLKAIHEMSKDARLCLNAIDITTHHDLKTAITTKLSKFKFTDRQAAIEKLMRYKGAYKEDNIQKQSPITKVIIE